jgi:hypothetical protein
MLVGESPQNRLFGTKCPKEVGCVTAAVAPVPYSFALPLAIKLKSIFHFPRLI